jgi:predicted MFS family arabinose efflux permease
MVPFAKARLALDEAQLGLVLLCLGLGSALTMPFAGWVNHRHGSRALVPVASALVCAAVPLLALAPSKIMLGVALAFFGAALGVLDVSMNAQAVDVERLAGRPLMSGFHALYSVGGLVAPAAMSVLLGAGLSLSACAAVIAALLVAIVATQARHLLAPAGDRPATRSMFTWPSKITVLLGLGCLVLFLAEGAMLDWGAVLLRSERGVALSSAGLGYAAFSVAMSIGRLLGDRVTAALGPTRIVRYGSLIAAAGFVLASALPWAASSMAGFVLVGIGASNVVPVLFSAAGRIPGTAPGVALATITTFGYTGVLSGPAAIGAVAHAIGLPLALGAVAVLLVLVSTSASIVRRDRSAP